MQHAQALLGTISGGAGMHVWIPTLVVWYSPVYLEYHTTDNGGLARGWDRKMASPGIPVSWRGRRPLRTKVTRDDARLSRAVLRHIYASEAPSKTAPQSKA